MFSFSLSERTFVGLTACVCVCFFKFRSLSFLVKLEQLDLGSNELEVLVSQHFDSFNLPVKITQ